MRRRAPWRDHPARDELLRFFGEADALVVGVRCDCAGATRAEEARCCQFRVTGREPYPTPVELCEVDLAIQSRGVPRERPARRRSLLVAEHGACPLLASDGKCTIYPARPFGCRTFFCAGHEPPRRTRDAIQALGRRIVELAARVFPEDPGPRPLSRALSGTLPAPPPTSDRARGARHRSG